MFWSWSWDSPETLLGILTANDVHISTPDEEYTCSLISIGIVIGRIDILINKERIND